MNWHSTGIKGQDGAQRTFVIHSLIKKKRNQTELVSPAELSTCKRDGMSRYIEDIPPKLEKLKTKPLSPDTVTRENRKDFLVPVSAYG